MSLSQLQAPRSAPRQTGWGWPAIDHPGPIGGNVTACTTGPDRIHLLAVGTDNRMHVQSRVDDGNWSGWAELDGDGRFELGATPGVVSRAPGRLEVFCRGLDGHVWLNVLSGDPTDRWTGWFPIEHAGPIVGNVTVCTSGTDHLQLFAIGTDEAVRTQCWLDDQGWSGWCRLDSRAFRDIATPAIVSRQPGRFEVFCRGTDGHVWSTASPDRYRPDGWTPWRRLADPAPTGGNVAVCSAGPDDLHLFTVGADRRMYGQHWRDDDGWSGWRELDGDGRFDADADATPSAVCTGPGQVEVFCADRDGNVRHHVTTTS
ncbi:MAG: hypothetical protein ABW195_15980 [Ilumatobacteraceae bacterium]